MNNINTKNLIGGTLLVVAAAVMLALAKTCVGDAVVHLVGKAAWYLPFAALVCGVRFLARV